ncbi:hypothetical protein [Streptomyces sp. WMMB 322]|uniref:hypothetical protein n=1 Tax=Streptomyces sp. WMMB 322 TaxID=1286821 RepID=UPI0006E18561|nr:hypothetical protein [Streptomyces sp. WMMB 322]SCK55744.1 hypothetical protein H180DRAFT_05143 [Streptomyces sp. WMMB 322]
MAALKCSKCGARIQLDGTSSCSCPPAATGRNDVSAFQAFRPRLKASSRQLERGAAGRSFERARRSLDRRGTGVAVGVAAAVALGTVAFSVDAMNSGSSVQGGGRPAVSVSPDPDIVAREAAERSDGQGAPEQPQAGNPPPAMDDEGMRPAGEEQEEHPGSQPPPSDDGEPAPSPSGDDAGGAAQGGSTGDPGGGDDGDAGGDTGDGGASDAGGSQGGGGQDEDDDGGLLGGLLGFLFGGGQDDGDDGKDQREAADHGGGKDSGSGPKGGAPHGGGGHKGGGGPHGGGPHGGGGRH